MSWDQKFMGLARHIATWSKDPSTKVGAVVVNDLHLVRNVGFNGLPRGIEDTDARLLDREWKLVHMVHAERNAILTADPGVLGCTLYSTAAPCVDCVLEMIQAGIFEVVVPIPEQDPFRDRPDWYEKIARGTALLREARIKYRDMEFLG